MKTALWEQIANYLYTNFADTAFTKEEVVSAYGKISPSSWKALLTHECIIDNGDNTFSCNSDSPAAIDCSNRHYSFSVNYNGTMRAGIGDRFDNSDLPLINKYYFAWKNMNEINQSFGMRRLNLPELLSEGLACALMDNWIRTNNTTITNASGSGDAIDVKTGEIIQIKGISTTKNSKVGPTSFGPRSEWDVLVCIHVDCDADTAYFYLLTQDYKSFKVNATETIADQQACGLRPRLQLLDKIKEFNIQPFKTYHFTQEG